eukprot:GILK01011152.1.p1 GENE.GILK01011152.1~~GILK01011152.1.p1  ORF type:complete len:1414 (-),score=327.31 GILK01011152.1:23-4129(-)
MSNEPRKSGRTKVSPTNKAQPKSKGKKRTLDDLELSVESIFHQGKPIESHEYNEIYGLEEPSCPASCKSNCSMNPNCLYGLGEKKKGIWTSKPQAMQLLGYDPSQDIRVQRAHIGLRNLGATCYMNCLLQLLFMNREFRHGLYQMHIGDSNKTEDMVTLQLQKVFAFLEWGNQKTYSPSELTRTLNLSTSIQQDAQEFNKLLLTVLEKSLARAPQDKPHIQRLVQRLFQGTVAYVTTCQKCMKRSPRETQFYELEMHLQGKSSLEQCMASLFQPEELTGQDQYFCENCNSKQDALRSQEIISLPQVLNLQLMRFVYDWKAGGKRKLQENLSFPLALDMSFAMTVATDSTATGNGDHRHQNGQPQPSDQPLLCARCRQRLETSFKFCPQCGEAVPVSVQKPVQVSQPEDYIYDLVAVLVHKGSSANSGHYIADLKDKSTGLWYRFDDESVTLLDSNQTEAHTSDQLKEKEKEKDVASDCSDVMELDGPPVVAQSNKDTKPKKGRTKALLSKSNNKAGSSNGKIASEPITIADAEESPVHSIYTGTDRASSRNAYMLVYERRTTSRIGAESNPIETASLDSISELKDEVLARNAEFENEVAEYNVRKEKVTTWLEARRNLAERVYAEIHPKVGESSYWIPTEWFKKWVTGEPENPKDKKKENGGLEVVGIASDVGSANRYTLQYLLTYPGPIPTYDIVCAHDCLDPLRVWNGDVKRVSAFAWAMLKSEFGLASEPKSAKSHLNSVLDVDSLPTKAADVETVPELVVEECFCKDCSRSFLTEKKRRKMQSAERQIVSTSLAKYKNKSTAANLAPHEAVWVSKRWFADWKIKQEDHPIVAEKDPWGRPLHPSVTSSVQLGSNMTEDITCEHGGLSVNKTNRRLLGMDAWVLLRERFPAGMEFDAQEVSCVVCAEAENLTKEQTEMSREERNREKQQVAGAYKGSQRLATCRVNGKKALPQGVYYLIEGQWIADWRKYLDNPSEPMRPGPICNQSLLCEDHNKLIYDPSVVFANLLALDSTPESTEYLNVKKSESISIIKLEDWNYLQAVYSGGPAIKLEVVHSSADTGSARQPVQVIDDPIQEIIDADMTDDGPSKKESKQSSNIQIFIDNIHPPLCLHCIREREAKERQSKFVYQVAEISVRKLRDDQAVTTTGGNVSTGSAAPKRSTRASNVYKVVVNCDDDLNLLKCKIYEVSEIGPSRQMLFLNGTQLTDSEATLGELGILPNSCLELKVTESKGLDEDLMYLLPDKDSRQNIETGFKGTALHVSNDDRASESTQRSQAPPPPPANASSASSTISSSSTSRPTPTRFYGESDGDNASSDEEFQLCLPTRKRTVSPSQKTSKKFKQDRDTLTASLNATNTPTSLSLPTR